jgi:hypothetical protein
VIEMRFQYALKDAKAVDKAAKTLEEELKAYVRSSVPPKG